MKDSWVIELKWSCKSCDATDILGRYKSCPSCGNPREKSEMKMSGLDDTSSPAIQETELLDLAQSGVDWFCTHCFSGNKGDGDSCVACAAPRYGSAKEDHPDFPNTPEEEVQPYQPYTIPQTYFAPETQKEVAFEKSHLKWYLLGGFLVLVAVFTSWALITHEVAGSVQSMTWERTIQPERWDDTTVSKWQHQTSEISEISPKKGSGERAGIKMISGSCRREFFENERYICGSHEECKDIYRSERESYSCTKSESYSCGQTCTDSGNGFARCSTKYCTKSVPDTCYRNRDVFDHKSCRSVQDYCTRPIHKTKCDYATQSWMTLSLLSTKGTGKEMYWSKVNTDLDDVRYKYSAQYSITYSYKNLGETETHQEVWRSYLVGKLAAEGSASEYITWSLNQAATLDVRNFGGVSDVRQVSQKQ